MSGENTLQSGEKNKNSKKNSKVVKTSNFIENHLKSMKITQNDQKLKKLLKTIETD